ncbi:glycosyltransferase [Candidatus Laterigemmans baculatus]|uniref:glycosyltransferase n=1 Tax=Candidatus Laterigemmans baculatus TaxID=2770505 RepID=UPI0013DCD11A|nr:glycosyltransferase [Candidatus Laterigemmans baculatus]
MSQTIPTSLASSSPSPADSYFAEAVPGGREGAVRQGTVSVLHIINGQHFAGAERVQVHLGRCLPSEGFRADFACLTPGRFLEQCPRDESEVFAVPMRSRYDLGVAGRILAAVGSRRYQLLHAHTPRSAMVAARIAKRLDVPWIYHVHSPTANDSSRWLQNQLNYWVERWSLRSAAHLITVSNSLRKQMIAEGWAADRVSVVANGVPAIRPPRQQIPTPGGRWVLGMVALMRPRKGLEVALRALVELRKRELDVRLRCIGPFETAEYEASIRRLISELGLEDAVELSGFASDVPAALAELDAMVLPSLYGEGMPMVVLEAMAAGLPVVATRVEGTPEAIRHGRDGLLAEPNSPQSLAEQLRLLVEGEYDWQALSESAVRRHAEQFSDRAMAHHTAGVYRRVV